MNTPTPLCSTCGKPRNGGPYCSNAFHLLLSTFDGGGLDIVYVCANADRDCGWERLFAWENAPSQCPFCAGEAISKASHLVATSDEWTWCEECGCALHNGKHVADDVGTCDR